MEKGQAFTLAEILIILAIIGIVATLTIPMLINNYQKTQQVTALRKVYSQLSEAIDRMMVIEGVEKFSDTTILNGNNADPKAFFKKYFRVSKFCAKEDFASCFAEATSMDKSKTTNPASDKTCVMVKDGTSICVHTYENAEYPPCFVVDTNGLSKPNIAGRDIFTFYAYWDGSIDDITPEGLAYAESTAREWRKASCEGSPYGAGCLSRIIDDGWKMDY